MPYIASEEHTSELQSHDNLVCRLLLEKKKTRRRRPPSRRARPPGRRQTVTGAAPCRAPPTPRSGLPPGVAVVRLLWCVFFFFNDTAPPEIYPLSLHAALPI